MATLDTRPARKVPPHWLRLNDKVSSPDAFLVLDTETSWTTGAQTEIHVPRCWALTLCERHLTGEVPMRKTSWSGPACIGLAERVSEIALDRPETWLFAHNLGFDLAVSALPDRLVEAGWELRDIWIGERSTWALLKNGRHTLAMTDSWSWLNAPLSEIATKIKRRKKPLPENDGTPAAWLARCETDVDVLCRALVILMEWWDANDLGRFGITGAACGWAAARHRIEPRSILVGPDDERNGFERSAIYGGRREAFYIGVVRRSSACDYDLVGAYPTVAAARNLPRRPAKPFGSLPADSPWIDSQSIGIIAEVIVTTKEPIAPCRIGREVWWPIGTFRTTLCGPEISLAIERGATVEIGHGWSYDLGPALQRWARWCLDLSDRSNTTAPAIVKMVAKGWGRSVIGRFATRTSQQVLDRPATTPGWSLTHGRHAESGAPLDILTIGGRERWYLQDQEGADSFPAIFAYVESHCRAALTRIILTRLAGSVVQCDTDGWLQREPYRKSGLDLPEVPEPFRVHRKGIYDHVEIIGPTHLNLDQTARWAGVGSARDGDDSTGYTWWDWPGLRWQLQHSQPGTYVRTKRKSMVHYDVVKRWIWQDGTTTPAQARLGADGRTELVLDEGTAWHAFMGHLAGAQHPVLAAMLAESGVDVAGFDSRPHRATASV